MTLESLRALQKRVRDCTGPDRELDFAICKTFKLGPLWCSRYITDPDDMAPRFSTDPDGLGACVALMHATLPQWRREVFEVWGVSGNVAQSWEIAEVRVKLESPSPDGEIRETHHLETHATLLAIISARIAELEAEQEKEKTDV